MKIIASYILAAVFVSPVSAGDEPRRPGDCRGSTMKHKDLIRPNQAICRDGYRYGINRDGVFGLWDEDDKLVESYVDDEGPAQWLEVWEGNDGRRTYLTLYDRRDKVIWQVFCERLSGDKPTKLQIKDRSSNIVRFRQGGTLWEVGHDGDPDIANSKCKYATHEPGDDDDDDDDDDDSGEYFRAKNRASSDLCIKGSDNTRLSDCSSSNDKLKWKIDADGRLYTKNDRRGCLYAEDDKGGERVNYDDEDCDDRDHAEWEVTDKNQIELKNTGLCLTYEQPGGKSPSEGDRMIIRSCEGFPRFRYDLE